MRPRPLISAHRGSCGVEGLPPAESYERAIRLGVDYVELDVRRTRDGALFVRHDATVPSGRLIGELTAVELRHELGAGALDYAELLALAKGRVRLHVDIKEIGSEEAVVAPLLAGWAPREFVITTLEDPSVIAIKRLHPEIRIGLSLGRDVEHEPLWVRARVRLSELYPARRVASCGPEFLAIHRRLARLRVLEYCSRRAMPAWVWTVDDEPGLSSFLADRRVETIVTNRPDLALRLRNAAPATP